MSLNPDNVRDALAALDHYNALVDSLGGVAKIEAWWKDRRRGAYFSHKTRGHIADTARMMLRELPADHPGQAHHAAADRLWWAMALRLCKTNARTIGYITERHRGPMDYSAAESHAREGAHRAAIRWDPVRGIRFSTFARHWIRACVTRAARAESPGRPTSEVIDIITHAERMRRDGLSDAEIRDALDVTPARWAEANYGRRFCMVSTEERRRSHFAGANDDRAPTLLDVVHNDSGAQAEDMERALDLAGAGDTLAAAMRSLSPRQRHVLAAHASGRTLADIGAEIGLSRERVRQIRNAARERLRALPEVAALVEVCP